MKKFISLLSLLIFSIFLCSATKLTVKKSRSLPKNQIVEIEVVINGKIVTSEKDIPYLMRMFKPGMFQLVTKDNPFTIKLKDSKSNTAKITVRTLILTKKGPKTQTKTVELKNIKKNVIVTVNKNKKDNIKLTVSGKCNVKFVK